MSKLKTQITNHQSPTTSHHLLFTVYCLLFIAFLFTPFTISAQELSLSISPPLLEVMVQPGKEVSFPFVVSNQGVDTLVAVEVKPFIPADEFGQVQILPTTDNRLVDASSWLEITKPKISIGQTFALKAAASQEIVIKFAPPPQAPEGDYYLSLLLESQNPPRLGLNDSQSRLRIGANILLTVSKSGQPLKKAEIVEFSAPKLVDSLFPLKYQIRIKNTGAAFFKPIGQIMIDPTLGQTQTLKLAPQNILVSSTRQVNCLEEEVLVECRLPGKIHLGLYQATLEFNLDDTGQLYQAKTQTLALPFSLIFALALFIFILRLVKNIFSKSTSERRGANISPPDG